MKGRKPANGGENLERGAGETDTLDPTEERRARGAVERFDKPIEDGYGLISMPWRSIDILAAMERRGAITTPMRAAGEAFRTQFTLAQLHALQSTDLARPFVDGGCYRLPRVRGRVEDAREGVWRALMAVGGSGSPAGSCLWHCVGWEMSLREWAQQRGWNGRRMGEKAASGVLIAALGMLEAFYVRERT